MRALAFRMSKIALALAMLLPTAAGQELDGPAHLFQDALLDHLAGNWKISGKLLSQDTDHTLQAVWVLNHQFLQVHEKDNIPAKPGQVPYEAIVMIGYDNMSDRYVAHWNDVYGGRFSETLGYGTREGDEIRFVFEYPDGPFHTTFRWKPQAGEWEWVMRTRNKTGQWVEFADLTLTPAEETQKKEPPHKEP